MPEFRTLEEYSKTTSERTRNLRFLATISLAGLASGVATAGLTFVRGGMPLFVLLGSPFGAAIACSLAISGMARSVLKAICIVALTTAALYIARMLTFWAEADLWGKWSLGSEPAVSPYSLFVGGMAGGFIVLGGILSLARPNMRLRKLALNALLWSIFAGALGPIGWALGPSLGTLVVPDYQVAARANGSNEVALFVVWQTGMAFVLGIILRPSRANSPSKD